MEPIPHLKLPLLKNRTWLLLLLLAAAFFCRAPAAAERAGTGATSAIDRFIDNGGYAVEKDGRILAAHNLHIMFAPASVIKIGTGLAALHMLGSDYRFETHFFVDADQNLYIKGFGDPFLISEEVAFIAGNLKELGCASVNNIYLDDSAFAIGTAADGTGASDNPYDAQNSGLAVNFNTVNIKKDRAGNTHSAEAQTPTLALMAELAQDLVPGVHRVNITKETQDGNETIRRYTGELFQALLQKENIAGKGLIAFRTVPANLAPFYIHRSSKSLEDIIAELMLYSNNFIANQLFLTFGAKQYGYPATWEKSKLAMAEYLQKAFNLTRNDVRIEEGSGLSRKNGVTPHAMMVLLESFKPYSRLLPQEDGRFIKSGTLKGVYAYAGYFAGQGGRLDSFVLLLNQERNDRDQVLLLLEKLHRQGASP